MITEEIQEIVGTVEIQEMVEILETVETVETAEILETQETQEIQEMQETQETQGIQEVEEIGIRETVDISLIMEDTLIEGDRQDVTHQGTQEIQETTDVTDQVAEEIVHQELNHHVTDHQQIDHLETDRQQIVNVTDHHVLLLQEMTIDHHQEKKVLESPQSQRDLQ